MRAHSIVGPDGVVTLAWFHEPQANDALRGGVMPFDGDYMVADYGIHSREPREYALHNDVCPYTEGPCWYDGSGIRAVSLAELYLQAGEDALYDELEASYRAIFRAVPDPRISGTEYQS
jgi:hypothetical protein